MKQSLHGGCRTEEPARREGGGPKGGMMGTKGERSKKPRVRESPEGRAG